MTRYTKEGDSIEGEEIFCTFEKRPSYGKDRSRGKEEITITGNPASAIINKVYKYTEKK